MGLRKRVIPAVDCRRTCTTGRLSSIICTRSNSLGSIVDHEETRAILSITSCVACHDILSPRCPRTELVRPSKFSPFGKSRATSFAEVGMNPFQDRYPGYNPASPNLVLLYKLYELVPCFCKGELGGTGEICCSCMYGPPYNLNQISRFTLCSMLCITRRK